MERRWRKPGVSMAWSGGRQTPTRGLFACPKGKMAPMSEHQASVTIRKRRVTAYRGRGSIYNWLRAHHDLVAAKLATDEATWPTLCVEMVRHGVSGRGGETPTPGAAAKAWHRVCRDLERQPKRSGRLMPSRLSKDWRPAVAVPPPPVFSPPVPVAQPQYPSRVMLDKAEEKPLSPEAQAELDRASAMLKEYDAERFRFGGG